MLTLTVKLLVALTCFTAVYLSTEAADTCRATTTSCVPGPPGRDGRDGQPGRDGSDGVAGPPGHDGVPGRDGRDGLPAPAVTLSDADEQRLKADIVEMLREELSMLQCCNSTQTTPTPDTGTQCNGTSEDNSATSCKAIYECDSTTPSGYYWIRNSTGDAVQVYCDMETENCGNVTGWRRVANIDMTNASNTCPEGLTYTVESSTRMCTRSHTVYDRCSSVTFPTYSVPYTKVCGRARGYQYSGTSSFYGYHIRGQTTLDTAYVEGLSVTYGSPRKHVWTFAAERSKDNNYVYGNCPCNPHPSSPAAPTFVGEDYFCESGNTGLFESQWYLDDPLWDSQGCASGSPCCDRGGPWFTTTLSQEASSDIEVRICLSFPEYNIGVDQLEIYTY